MVKTLQYLESGKDIEGDNGSVIAPPPNFDMDKFYRGRLFFRDNLLSWCMGLLFSLLLGLTVPDFLITLVFTKKTDTPKMALKRYVSTFKHLAEWHYSDVWETGSAAHQSVQTVRAMHQKVRNNLQAEGKQNYLSQYHMAVVQSSFFVHPLMFPKQLGVLCPESTLDDYVYFWYGIGHALGIDSKYNLCSDGIDQALSYCKEVKDNIVYPNLENPSADFYIMVKAFIDGWSAMVPGLISYQFVLSFCTELDGKKPRQLAFVDRLRYVFWRVFFWCIKNVAWFRKFAHSSLEKAYGLSFQERVEP